MSDIIEFPKMPLGGAQLRAVSAQLAQVPQVIADELIDQGDELKDAATAADFASAVHSTAEKLREASQRWGALSGTIRDHWRI